MKKHALATVVCVGLGLSLAIGCGTAVDVTELPSTDGFETWYQVQYFGVVPGHGDSVRPVYINDIGRGYGHTGAYPDNTVAVKEIYERNADNSPGNLRYTAIMRKVGDRPVSAPVYGGWVFTILRPGAEEVSRELCWATCHRQAPIDGAFFDYGE